MSREKRKKNKREEARKKNRKGSDSLNIENRDLREITQMLKQGRIDTTRFRHVFNNYIKGEQKLKIEDVENAMKVFKSRLEGKEGRKKEKSR